MGKKIETLRDPAACGGLGLGKQTVFDLFWMDTVNQVCVLSDVGQIPF
jgi:hypothetical protein